MGTSFQVTRLFNSVGSAEAILGLNYTVGGIEPGKETVFINGNAAEGKNMRMICEK